MRKLLKLAWADPDIQIYQNSYYLQRDQYDVQVLYVPRMGAYKCAVYLNKKAVTEPVTFYDVKDAKAWFRTWRLSYKKKAAA